jgi:phospholipid/cholesterol/gamma-HCH transport system permease protein
LGAFLQALGGPWLLFARSLRQGLKTGVSLREVIVQIHEIGNRSVWLVTSGLAFFGVVMVAIADQQARRFTGNLTVIGPAYFELLVREFGPLTSALLAASRAGASSSAELASMKVHEQIEALEMSSGDPLSDLVAPRVIASAIAVPILCMLGTIAASMAAVSATFLIFRADGLAFIDARFLDRGDVACALIKAILCGLYIPVAASWRGLAARGGAEGIGRAVTRGVVDACMGCLVIDFVVALAFLLARV